jgi:hypothetical protein
MGPAIAATSPLLGRLASVRLGEPGPGEAHDIEASSPLVFGGLNDRESMVARDTVTETILLRWY